MAKKNTAKSGKSRNKNNKSKKYQAHHLAMILVCILIFEGILFSATNPADWDNAVTVLDVHEGVDQTTQDISVTFQPLADVVADINQFYQLSTIEMMHVLDLDESNTGWEIGFVYKGISDFYEQSSVQMTQLLDFSDSSLWPVTLAGLSVNTK